MNEQEQLNSLLQSQREVIKRQENIIDALNNTVRELKRILKGYEL